MSQTDRLLVGVSLLAVKRPPIGGLATYVREVAYALAASSVEEFLFFVPSDLADYWRDTLPDKARCHVTSLDNRSPIIRSLYESLRLPTLATAMGCSVLFFPNTIAPIRRSPPSIVSVLDVMYRSQEHATPLHKRLYLDLSLMLLRMAGTEIVTISEFSKHDIATRSGIDARHITAIPCGVSPQFFSAISEPRPSIIGDGPYVLSVGAAYPHKRLRTVVEAFSTVASRFPNLRLCMAGTVQGSQREMAGVSETIASSAYRSRILMVPPLEWEQMPALYSHASALLHASRFEGFGLPIAEAMACGTPVAASPAEAVIEVLGGSGEVAADWSHEALGAALSRVLNLPRELRAVRAAEARRSAGERFRWSVVAERLRSHFQHVAAGFSAPSGSEKVNL
jgi:glycosyltransferase involved in cell wall biosynthesis